MCGVWRAIMLLCCCVNTMKTGIKMTLKFVYLSKVSPCKPSLS